MIHLACYGKQTPCFILKLPGLNSFKRTWHYIFHGLLQTHQKTVVQFLQHISVVSCVIMDLLYKWMSNGWSHADDRWLYQMCPVCTFITHESEVNQENTNLHKCHFKQFQLHY